MSDQKGGTSDIYVNLEQLVFQLSHTRVVLKKLSKSVLADFLVKHVIAKTRVVHADTVIKMQYHRSKDDAVKSIESYCISCQRKKILDKLRRNCEICRHRLLFHCLRCNSEKLDHNLMLSHLHDQIIFYCSKCGFCSTNSGELQNHAKSVHKKMLVFQCLRCNKMIKNFGGLRTHEKYCGKVVTNINCTVCERNYKTRAGLEQHVRRMHLKAE